MTPGYSTKAFEKKYTYAGRLGSVWTPERTDFRLWAPTAQEAEVRLYAGGREGEDDLLGRIPMRRDVNGTWVCTGVGDLNGVYYTYAVTVDGELREAVDPYARAVGVNGRRGMVIDLRSTDPEGWGEDRPPRWGEAPTDAVIYEVHVRDLSADESSGIKNRGLFAGLGETGTRTPGGAATGLDHIRQLGVTHVQLLPVYDYGSVDEARPEVPQYNWGYDPVNYNVPEGSYSSCPERGAVRIRELKEAVLALHRAGLGVVMDVVYNHVYDAETFCFNRLVPGYFSRIRRNGKYADGSNCGNDTASERSMVRKFIVDSVCYWAEEYHMDGFRFDLAGLIDVDTVNEIVGALRARRPDILLYGEGWTMGTYPTKRGVLLATQTNSGLTPGFAYFSDTVRDALRGSFFDRGPGFVSGKPGMEETVRRCFLGTPGWCRGPDQTVNYVSCHDDHTLFDRLTVSRPDAGRRELAAMNRLAAAVIFTARGIPFLLAGEELLRSKRDGEGRIVENSYNAPDSVNAIRWDCLDDDPEVQAVYAYYRGLISFRKAHPVLRRPRAGEGDIQCVEGLAPGAVAFRVLSPDGEELFIAFNAGAEEAELDLPQGEWDIFVDGQRAGTRSLGQARGRIALAPVSALMLKKR